MKIMHFTLDQLFAAQETLYSCVLGMTGLHGKVRATLSSLYCKQVFASSYFMGRSNRLSGNYISRGSRPFLLQQLLHTTATKKMKKGDERKNSCGT